MASSSVLGNFGVSPLQHIIEVRVMNSENSTYYYLYLRKDRLTGFYNFILRYRTMIALTKPIPGPGVSAPAATGLNAIFTIIPQKFPLADILLWLCTKQKTYLGSQMRVTLQEIEAALAKYGQVVPLLRGDGSEIQ